MIGAILFAVILYVITMELSLFVARRRGRRLFFDRPGAFGLLTFTQCGERPDDSSSRSFRRFPLSRVRRCRRAYKSCNRFFSATTSSSRGAGLNSAPMVASNCLSLMSTFSGPIRSA
jgi:hypothetical protein